MPLRRFFVLAVTGVMAAGATPALAQSATGQRSGGLFGATRSDTSDRNRLTMLFALSEGFDTEIPPEFQRQSPIAGPQSGGFSTLFTLSADYLKTAPRWQVAGTAQSAFRFYHQVETEATPSHNAAVQASVELSRTATLRVTQTAAYSPSYLFELFPNAALPGLDEPIAADPEYRIRETESFSYETSAMLEVGSQRGSRVTASADYSRTEFSRHVLDRPDMLRYSGRAKYSHGVGRSSAVSAEYEYRVGEMGLAPLSEHRINLGGQYSRALSTSRRATVRFNISPSSLEFSARMPNAPVIGRVYRLQGDASVDYQFRRTWRASGTYLRGVEYVAVLTRPVFADSVRADLTGLVGRRVELSVSAGYAAGGSALRRDSNHLETSTATARARFALTHTFALYTEYFYYFYDQGSLLLAPGLPNTFEQHGIRAGLMLWVPVF